MIVLDASAAVSALLNDGPARRLLAVESVHAPHLVDAEVISVLRRQVAAGLLASEQARRGTGCVEEARADSLRRFTSPGTCLGT